jgi:hypothetical protein
VPLATAIASIPQRLTFAHAGLPERLTGVGAPAKVVTDLINA